jgi:hypothetical protein
LKKHPLTFSKTKQLNSVWTAGSSVKDKQRLS